MGSITKFEELVAWQIGRQLSAQIYLITRKGEFIKDLRFSGQIRSAAISITSNIAEGFERGSPAEFHKFLIIAKASCAEVRSQLYTAKDIGYISEDEFKIVLTLAERVGSLVGALREAVRKRLN